MAQPLFWNEQRLSDISYGLSTKILFLKGISFLEDILGQWKNQKCIP